MLVQGVTNFVIPETMSAILYYKYGDPREVLEYKKVPTPKPNANQVLVKVHCASISAADWHLIRASPFPVRFAYGLFGPKYHIPGADFAGTIVQVGEKVEKWKVGDKVFGDLSGKKLGAYAEYVCMDVDQFVSKPESVSMEEAAASPISAMTALKGLKDVANVKNGQKVLINGASGGVGSFAVQIAKSMGAIVTAVCGTEKMEMMQTIGADHIIDYRTEDVTKRSEKFDVILDLAAFRSAREYLPILSDNGIYVYGGGDENLLFEIILKGSWIGKKGQRFVNYLSTPNLESLTTIQELLRDGKIRPYIKQRYPLSEVANAIHQMEERSIQGKVIINISEELFL